MTALRRLPRTVVLAAAVALLTVLATGPTRSEDAVTEWTIEADRLGGGGANWHSLAIMHMAMHDAAQAVQPRYARWYPDGPAMAATDLSVEAAMASAAAEVLSELHPAARADIAALLQSALAPISAGPGKSGGVVLGRAIGSDAVRRRANDGYGRIHPFVASTEAGRWRPAPPSFESSNTTDAVPFLFAGRVWPGERPPPELESAAAARNTREAGALGSEHAPQRTPVQTAAAQFWAYQSSQRGFVLLAVRLLGADSTSDLPDRARLMSLLTAAMADSAVLTWAEKERYSAWRPITALQGGAAGLPPDPAWQPLIETPPHPEYPSGHAADCFTGAGALERLFHVDGPIDYVAQSALPQSDVAAVGMGQHAQVGGLHELSRRFPSLAAVAEDCANSRLWAGAHFRSANEESHRLADAIVTRAQAALPKRPVR